MAFYQKHRPKQFADLIGEDHIKDTLLEASKSGKLSHAFLLCGPRGTGKTTTARLLAKAVNCLEIQNDRKEGKATSGEPCNKCTACTEIDLGKGIDVIEIDAASHTKVEEIREVIDKARFLPTSFLKKVYIIDEVHMLSTSSFNALLKTLEEPPAHVVFILATTEVHKLPATILSRVQRYDFKRIKIDDLISNLKTIAKSENINIDDKTLELIAIRAEGGHRDAVSLLEQVFSTGDSSFENASRLLGRSDSSTILGFIRAIFSNHPEEGLKIAQGVYKESVNLAFFNKEIINYLRLILLSKISNEINLEDTKENVEQIKKLSDLCSPDQIVKILKIFINTAQTLKDLAFPLVPIEMAVVEACSLIPNNKPEVNIEKSKVAEQKEAKDESLKPSVDISLSSTVPVAVLDMTADVWQKIIDKIKMENATLAALLRDAKPLELTDKKIVLGVKFAFHKENISNAKNCAVLEKVIEELMGKKLVVECRISEKKDKKTMESLPNDELQKAVEEMFL